MGFEPTTPTLPVWCAPSCATGPYKTALQKNQNYYSKNRYNCQIFFLNLSKNIKQAILFYIISYAAQVLGFFLEGLSYYHFISGDSVTYVLVYGVTEWLAILLGIAYIIAIVCYIFVKLIDKIPER